MIHDMAEGRRSTSTAAEAEYDQRLVERFQKGDESAFEEIVTRHRRRICSIAFRWLKNFSDAEDIAQDTLIRAYRGLGKFRGDSSLATWLHSIATNLSQNRYSYFLRRRRRDHVSLDYTFSEDEKLSFSDLLGSQEDGPVEGVMAEEFHRIVMECMDRLPPIHRRPLLLRMDEDISDRSIGSSLRIKEGTVKSRLHRARSALLVLVGMRYPGVLSRGDILSMVQRGKGPGILKRA